MIEFRPKVSFTHDESPQRIVEKVTAHARRNNPARLIIEKDDRSLLLKFPVERAELWSPQMEVHLHSTGDGRTAVTGIIGPKNSIWTIFRAGLLLITIIGALGLLLGFYQWVLKMAPWGFYLAVAGLCAGLFTWFLSEEGKRRAQDEMDLLRTFMDEALGVDHFLSAVPRRSDLTYGRAV